MTSHWSKSPRRWSRAVAAATFAAAATFTPICTPAAQAKPRLEVSRYTTFVGTEVDESSGLVWYDDHLLTVNDSGGKPIVYVSEGRAGKVTGRITFSQTKPRDVEALAMDQQGSVWVADIGDNYLRRKDIVLQRIDDVQLSGNSKVSAVTYRLRYPDGAQDAEAFVIHPKTGAKYVVTKALLGGRVLAAPEELSADQMNVLEPVAHAPGMVTDGVFSADGRFLFLRNYSELFVYEYPEFRPVVTFQLPLQDQGETITLGPDGTLLIGSEGAGSDVLQLRLPPEFAAGTLGQDAGGRADADLWLADDVHGRPELPWQWWTTVPVGLLLVAGGVHWTRMRAAR